MGGFGSGRTPKGGRRPRTRRLTTELAKIRSFDVMKRGWGEQGRRSVVLLNDRSGEKVGELVVTPEKIEYFRGEGKRPLLSAPMRRLSLPKGAVAYHFNCLECQRGTTALYWDYSRIACQKCHRLMHPSQSESNEDRWFRKRERLLQKHNIGIDDLRYGKKPPRMHWKTYRRLQALYRSWEDSSFLIFFNRFCYPDAYSEFQDAKQGAERCYEGRSKKVAALVADHLLR